MPLKCFNDAILVQPWDLCPPSHAEFKRVDASSRSELQDAWSSTSVRVPHAPVLEENQVEGEQEEEEG